MNIILEFLPKSIHQQRVFHPGKRSVGDWEVKGEGEGAYDQRRVCQV